MNESTWNLKPHLIIVITVLLFSGLACQKKPASAPAAIVPTIPVSQLIEREVTDFADYTGRTDAVQSVSVRARVTGYLMKMPFEEGAEIKAGSLLFQIDPRPYQALVDQAQSQVTLYQAQLKLAKTVLERNRSAGGAISQLEVDQSLATVEEAESRIKVAEATLNNAKLNLSFTDVHAPISGRISRYYYTPGNLVTQDQTLLTTIVSTDPMYAYFDVEERTFDRIVKGINAQRVLSPGIKPDFPVLMALEGEEGFPHSGKLNFVNNQVNPSTGTVAVRGIFANDRTSNGMWSLIPGRFVRIRLPLGTPYKARLVIERAIGSDQGLKFVYVLDAENKVQYRRVKTGSLQEDGLRVIEPYQAANGKEPESGVKPEEFVVVGGLQQIRPRAEIKPDKIAMPNLAGGDSSSTRRRPQPPPPGQEKPSVKKTGSDNPAGKK